jgi:UBX domain
LKEAQLYRERQEGYKSSIQDDIQRKAEEEKAEAERAAEEKAEQVRIATIEERRGKLRESLPEEADKDAPETITIALRFADGRAGQRRFDDSTPLTVILNWADAVFGVEREKIRLTTMNGQKSFSWEDVDATTLKEAGLGRLTGLRVMENDAGDVIESGGIVGATKVGDNV